MPPAAGIGDIALVEYATSKIDHDSNDDDNRKDAAWSYTSRFVWFHTRARMLGAHDKHVIALIRVRADKGDGRSRGDRVAVATESEGGRLAVDVVLCDLDRVQGARVTAGAALACATAAVAGGACGFVVIGLVGRVGPDGTSLRC